jgi:hypothetical protein
VREHSRGEFRGGSLRLRVWGWAPSCRLSPCEGVRHRYVRNRVVGRMRREGRVQV